MGVFTQYFNLPAYLLLVIIFVLCLVSSFIVYLLFSKELVKTIKDNTRAFATNEYYHNSVLDLKIKFAWLTAALAAAVAALSFVGYGTYSDIRVILEHDVREHIDSLQVELDKDVNLLKIELEIALKDTLDKQIPQNFAVLIDSADNLLNNMSVLYNDMGKKADIFELKYAKNLSISQEAFKDSIKKDIATIKRLKRSAEEFHAKAGIHYQNAREFETRIEAIYDSVSTK